VVMLATDPEYAIAVKVGQCQAKPVVSTTTTAASSADSLPELEVVPATTLPDAQGETGETTTVPTQTTVTATTTTTTTIPATTTTLPLATTTTIKGFTPFSTTLPPRPGGGTQITVPETGGLVPRETGAMEGRGIGRTPIIRFIQSSSRLGDLCEGVPVVTAGGSQSLAPADLVVGTVDLAANLDSLNFVRVLLYQPATEIPR